MVRICQKIIELGIIILIIFTPLFYGGVRLWTITLVDLIIVFLLFCWALEMLFSKKVVFVKTPLDVPILLFCGYAIISSLFFSRYFYASRLALHQILTFAALFFIVVNHLRTQRQLIFLVFVIIANGLVHATLHLVKNAAGLFGNRVWGWSFSVGNHFAGYLLPIIPICIALSFVALSQKQRVLYLIAGVVISAAMFFSLVAGAMLSFILSLMCIALLFGGTEPLRKKVAILSGVIALSLFVLFWIGIEPVLKELLTVTNWEEGSPAGRISLWKSALKMFADYSIVGTGLGAFNYVYPIYRLPDMPGMAVYAHSDWLQLLVEQGLIGLILALAGASIFLWMVIAKIRKHSRLSIDFRTVLWQNGFVVGGAAACLAILANVVVDFNLHIPAIALLFVVLLAITTVAAKSRFSMRTGFIKLPQREFILSEYLWAIICVGAIFLCGFGSMALAKPYLAERTRAKGGNFERLLFWEKAIEQYKKAIRYIPENADYFQILGKAYTYGAILSQNKAEWLSKAEEAYKQAIKLCPTSGDYYLALAEFYEINRQAEKAEDAYVKAIALDPNNAFYHRILGDYYLKRGKIKEAAKEYKLSIQLYPRDFIPILNRCYKLILRSQSKEAGAAKARRRSQSKEAGTAKARRRLQSKEAGTAKARRPRLAVRGTPHKAPKANQRGLFVSPSGSLANRLISYPDDFLFILRNIVPQNPDAHTAAADFLLRKGFLETALSQYQSALALEPHNIELRENVSRVLLQKGDREEALKIWKEALTAEMQTGETQERRHIAELHVHLAEIYAKLKRFKEAEREYLNAARLDDSNPRYLLEAGKIYMRQGRKTDAAKLWQSVIVKHPQNAEAHYQLGLFYERREDLSDAWKHFEAAISSNPANLNYRAHLAKSYYERGLYYQAIRQWEEILRLRPDDAATQLKLARVYQRINRQDKARKYYNSVLKLQPNNVEALAAVK